MQAVSHNTPQANLDFEITWNETNLRWLLGEEPRNEPLIEATKKKLEELKHENKTKETHCRTV